MSAVAIDSLIDYNEKLSLAWSRTDNTGTLPVEAQRARTRSESELIKLISTHGEAPN